VNHTLTTSLTGGKKVRDKKIFMMSFENKLEKKKKKKK